LTLTQETARMKIKQAPVTLSRLELAAVQAIRSNGPLSRTMLAEKLDYSRGSLTAVVSRLETLGVLQEAGQGKSAGGRPPLMLEVNPGFGFVAGVDIGASSVDIALADFNGNILARYGEPSDVRIGPESILSRISKLLTDMLIDLKVEANRVLAIGVGVPGPVEFARGVLIAPPLMPTWEGFPIQAFFQQYFPLARVVVDNDVNMMAKGEQKAGAGIGIENFLYIKIGTGIGCGIISHGDVYRGSDGCAGDVGHICVDIQGPVCHCGNRGCLEYMAAGTAIANKAMQGTAEGQSAFLAARMEKNGGVLSAKDVGDAAAAGDRLANEIVRESGRLIGGVLASLVNFYNPRAIFIGGGVSNIGNQLLSTLRQAILKRATALSTIKLRVEYSRLGEDAGVHGAIWMALENVFTLA
jgi:glucokinase-like ROK family protein